MTKKKNKEAVSPEIAPKPSPEIPPPSLITDADFKSIYTNFVLAQYTPFDVSLTIGEAVGPDSEGRQVVHQKARITMAAPEAKIVMLILANTLKVYEQQFGEIRLPPGQVPPEVLQK